MSTCALCRDNTGYSQFTIHKSYLTPHDASFCFSEEWLNSLHLVVLLRKFSWNCFNNKSIFFSFVKIFKSSPSTTNREFSFVPTLPYQVWPSDYQSARSKQLDRLKCSYQALNFGSWCENNLIWCWAISRSMCLRLYSTPYETITITTFLICQPFAC